MKRTLAFVIALAIGIGGAALLVSHRLNLQHAAELSSQQAAWQQEKPNWKRLWKTRGHPDPSLQLP